MNGALGRLGIVEAFQARHPVLARAVGVVLDGFELALYLLGLVVVFGVVTLLTGTLLGGVLVVWLVATYVVWGGRRRRARREEESARVVARALATARCADCGQPAGGAAAALTALSDLAAESRRTARHA